MEFNAVGGTGLLKFACVRISLNVIACRWQWR